MSQQAKEPISPAVLDYSAADYSHPRRGAMFWGGWVLSVLPALMLLLDAVMKLAKPAMVVEGTAKIGWPQSAIVPLGVVLLISAVLYLIPNTAVLGAILLTGYLGGAVGAHVRVEDALFSHTLFPVYFGVVLWLGLWMRDARVRALAPLRTV